MKVDGVARRSIQLAADGRGVEIVDQTLLPHRFETRELRVLSDATEAISAMRVRGAPLIGATAAYGVALQMREESSDASLQRAIEALLATRPTAVNLSWALDEMRASLRELPPAAREARAYARAAAICDEDVENCRAIGEHGLRLIEALHERRAERGPLNVLTHCNAGWLATVDWGTALAPVYLAHDRGIAIHVWVDETRPRNQGASLTAWELGQHGVSHTVIADNAGGHLMQRGRVDLCITGSDRTTSTGDVCNKIGTYLKALAARDNGVPFYVALPTSSIDWTLSDGLAEIPIEERDGAELSCVRGRNADGDTVEVAVTPASSPVANPAFDVTPARLVTGLITERGVCEASAAGLAGLYPERSAQSASS
ncbi:MAG: S-methyl-5-thioribose-1-phosphate isomerase [Deltaproteobacteria bacterium]|jgi:methylthioribose-1-phosphate isomerase|nr:S-methyl-5-thioribose-1-phosphate isomerase [Deltaproteobacteria bacterium]